MFRRHKKHALEESMDEVIVPFLDMAFQLLFFFIINYNPSDLEGQMELSLPSKSAAAAKNPDDVSPMSESHRDEIDIPADITVVVTTQKDPATRGAISSIALQDKAGRKALPGGLDNVLATLETKLKEAQDGLTNKEAIKIEADAALKWSEVVKVVDVCRKTGFVNVSFVPPPDLGISSQ